MSANHVGRETVIQALPCPGCVLAGIPPSAIVCPTCRGTGKRSWRLSRWTRAVWDEYLAWARTQIPDPLEVAARHLEKYPPAFQEGLVRHAIECSHQYLSLNSQPIMDLMASLEGSSYLLWLLLRQHQPEATPDDALDIAWELGAEKLQKQMERTSGKVDGGAPNSPAPEAS